MIGNEIDVDDGPAFAAACAPLVQSLGGGFMISPQAKAFSQRHGMRGRQGYFVGRGSVLGDVDADVVTAAFGFFPADIVREMWDAGRTAVDVATAREDYAEACRDWGRARLETFAAAGRLAELLGWVVDGADVAGSPALRRLARDTAAVRRPRAGGAAAARAAGVPRRACTSSPSSPRGSRRCRRSSRARAARGNASFFGWEEPFEDVSGLVVARSEAESLTDRLVTPSWDVLGHDERVELLALLAEAATLAFGHAAP